MHRLASRSKAWWAERACSVQADPPSPASITSISGQASSPRTSPSHTRLTFITSACSTSSVSVTSPEAAAVRAALAGSLAGLERHHPRMPVGQLVQQQLEVLLDRGQVLLDRQLVGQRPQQQGLAGALSAGDDDVLAGPHRRPQELGQRPVDRPQTDQVVEVDVADPVAADHQLRSRHGLDHRRQPRPVRAAAWSAAGWPWSASAPRGPAGRRCAAAAAPGPRRSRRSGRPGRPGRRRSRPTRCRSRAPRCSPPAGRPRRAAGGPARTGRRTPPRRSPAPRPARGPPARRASAPGPARRPVLDAACGPAPAGPRSSASGGA